MKKPLFFLSFIDHPHSPLSKRIQRRREERSVCFASKEVEAINR
jgi:hypothetical protein